ncbi:coiled-coil domain-containing protein 50 [Culicoides brevitarsis]|uniref:coiled-coil domain-containing protein 50 n=1 Tax=Culicoides brevitarsis TaxID=469753 RepID=UPI00307C96EF
MSDCKEYDDLFPRSVNEAVRNFRLKEDFSLASALQEHEYTVAREENRIKNSLLRIDYPKALDEQQKENENAQLEEQKKKSLERRRQKIDEEIARELAQQLRHERKYKEKKKNDVQHTLHLEQHTPIKIKQEHNFIRDIKYGNSSEKEIQDKHTALEALRLLDCDVADALKKLEQEQSDQELAWKIQNLEISPNLTQENIDMKLALEAQDEEVARMLYSREKAKLKKAREKARLKKEKNKQSQDLIYHDNSEKGTSLTTDTYNFTKKDNVTDENIYLDPFDIKDSSACMSEVTSEKNDSGADPNILFTKVNHTTKKDDDIPPYMPIQGSRRQQTEIPRKKKDKCSQQ